MKLRNKKTGEVIETCKIIQNAFGEIIMLTLDEDERYPYEYSSLTELTSEWEDYEPKEPIFDEKIRRGIRAWWDMQDNPFKSAAVMRCGGKDLDGFYHWRIFGYIRDGEQRESTDLCFRTKKLYDYDEAHDYTKEELCGEEK